MMATFYMLQSDNRFHWAMENSVEIYVPLHGALTHSIYLFGQVVRTSQDIKEKNNFLK